MREKEILFQNLYWQGGQDLHIIQAFQKKQLRSVSYVTLQNWNIVLIRPGNMNLVMSSHHTDARGPPKQTEQTRCKPELHTLFSFKMKNMLEKKKKVII